MERIPTMEERIGHCRRKKKGEEWGRTKKKHGVKENERNTSLQKEEKADEKGKERRVKNVDKIVDCKKKKKEKNSR